MNLNRERLVMVKKYYSQHSRTKHTYQFYKDRQNDPKWRNDFIEARSKRRKSIAIKSLAVLLVICIAAFFTFRQHNKNNGEISATFSQNSSNQNSSSDQDSQKSSTISSSTTQQSSYSYSSDTSLSSSTTEASSSETSTTNNITAVKNVLQSGFEIAPILYNGEDVGKAMDEGKAPQNTIHDGVEFGYLKDDSLARMSLMGGAFDQPYEISEGILTIGHFQFNYSENGNSITFDTYEKSYSDGSTITWQLSSYPGAKYSVDSAYVQN